MKYEQDYVFVLGVCVLCVLCVCVSRPDPVNEQPFCRSSGVML